MRDVLSRDQIRAFDRYATDVARVPSALLMENAGRGAVDAILAEVDGGPHRFVVLCGPGNNGGDGFVVARRLVTLGHEARVMLTVPGDRLKGDARINHDAWVALGNEVEALSSETLARLEENLVWCTVAVDALMGTGLARDLEGELAELVAHVNRAKAYRVALDIPTGLDANTGQVLGTVVHAHLTVTFAHPKLGLYGAKAADAVGKIVTADIGVPPSISDEVGISATVTERADILEILGRRPASTHKGRAGRVLVVGGSAGKTGAALLSAHAALRAGAGLVTIACFEDAAPALETKVVEVMTHPISRKDPVSSLAALQGQADAIVVGPGIGLDDDARTVVEHLLLQHPGVVVADADALTLFAGRAARLAAACGPRVLTPHPGEMARLLDVSVEEAERDRFATLQRAVATTRANILYKGERTLCAAPEDFPCINPTGAPALATAGSGDVLSGVVAAFACSADPFEAALAAAYIHGLAGEAWSSSSGSDRGLLAKEIADALPRVLGRLLA